MAQSNSNRIKRNVHTLPNSKGASRAITQQWSLFITYFIEGRPPSGGHVILHYYFIQSSRGRLLKRNTPYEAPSNKFRRPLGSSPFDDRIFSQKKRTFIIFFIPWKNFGRFLSENSSPLCRKFRKSRICGVFWVLIDLNVCLLDDWFGNDLLLLIFF